MATHYPNERFLRRVIDERDGAIRLCFHDAAFELYVREVEP